MRKQCNWAVACSLGLSLLLGTNLWAGGLNTDNLSVFQNATFYGKLQVHPWTNSAASMTNGLIFYIPFVTNTPTTVSDASGCGNTGTLSNGVVIDTNGVSAQEGIFDGSNDYVEFGNVASLGLTSGCFSIVAWMKLGDIDGVGEYVLSKDHVSNRGYGFGHYQNRLYWEINGASKIAKNLGNVSGDLSLSIWYHSALTYNGTSYVAYLNCVQVGSATGINPPANSANVNMGRRQYTGAEQYFHGNLDEVRVFNRCLSSDELEDLYATDSAATTHSVTFQSGIEYLAPLSDVSMGTYTN